MRSRDRHEEARLQLARGLLGQPGKLIPPDVYARLESEELEAIHAIDRALESTPLPEPFDLTLVLNFLQGASWESFDEEAWREAVEFLVTKVVVSADKSSQIEYRQPGLFAHFTTAAELESW